jgi:hypothetical protein
VAFYRGIPYEITWEIFVLRLSRAQFEGGGKRGEVLYYLGICLE